MTSISSNSTQEHVDAAKELIDYCESKEIPLRAVQVGRVRLGFAKYPAIETRVGGAGNYIATDPSFTRSVAEGLEARPEPGKEKPGAGSLDEQWAKEMGVDLNAGTDNAEGVGQ